MTSDEMTTGTGTENGRTEDYTIKEPKGVFETLLEAVAEACERTTGRPRGEFERTARLMREEPLLMKAVGCGRVMVALETIGTAARAAALERMDPELQRRKEELDGDLGRLVERYKTLVWEQQTRLAERFAFEAEDWFKKGMEGRE